MPVWQGFKYTTASWPRSNHNSRVENKMPLRLFAFISSSLYSSLYKHLLIDRNLSELVALLTCASHSSLVLMSSLLAGEMEIGAITAQDAAYLPREKKHPNVKPTASRAASPLLVWEEKPLNLAAISHHILFLGFTVNKGAFVAWCPQRLSVRLWNAALSNTSHF